jgi:VWFA-related protein
MRSLHMICRFVGFFALLAVSASPIVAQASSESGAVRETASVTLVEVPVNVIGKDGRPVAGLSAADFDLYDDGKKQALTGFDVVDLNRPATAAAPAASISAAPQPAARRHWLIVFDLSYASLTGLVRARDGAEAFVRAMRDSDLAAVATLSTDTGWNLLANFSQDRRQLSEAIRTLGLPGKTHRSSDPLGLLFTAPGGGMSASAGGSPRSEMLAEDLRELQQTLQKPATDSLARGKATQLMKSLAGIGRTLDSVRGRKYVLFFSEGFETRLLSGDAGPGIATGAPFSSAPTNEAANNAISGEIWKVDSEARFGSTGTRSVLTLAMAEFKRSDTVLDTIDISGLRAAGDASNSARPGSGTDALFAMASETGGDLVRNANQLGGEIEKLLERTGLVYVLAYQPTSRTRPGAFHEIRVKVRRSGAKVIARAGYYEPRPFASLSPLERVLASGDLVTSGTRENSLAAELLCAAIPDEGLLARVPVVIEIAGAPLLAGESGGRTAVQIFAYAVNSQGTLADYLSQELTLDLSRVREKLESGGVKFYGMLSLPPGDYAIRSLVRQASTGRSAVLTSPVRVPVSGGAAVVLPPLFPDRSGRWLFVKATPRSDSPAGNSDYPFAVDGESFVPAARPIVAARADGAPVTATVLTYNFGAARADPLQVVGEVVGDDGKPRPVEVSVVSRSDSGKAGARAVTLGIRTDRLAGGRYVLKVRVSDRVSRKSAEAATAFEVR